MQDTTSPSMASINRSSGSFSVAGAKPTAGQDTSSPSMTSFLKRPARRQQTFQQPRIAAADTPSAAVVAPLASAAVDFSRRLSADPFNKARTSNLSASDLLHLLSPSVAATSAKPGSSASLGPYSCRACDQRFPSLHALDGHHKAAHPTVSGGAGKKVTNEARRPVGVATAPLSFVEALEARKRVAKEEPIARASPVAAAKPAYVDARESQMVVESATDAVGETNNMEETRKSRGARKASDTLSPSPRAQKKPSRATSHRHRFAALVEAATAASESPEGDAAESPAASARDADESMEGERAGMAATELAAALVHLKAPAMPVAPHRPVSLKQAEFGSRKLCMGSSPSPAASEVTGENVVGPAHQPQTPAYQPPSQLAQDLSAAANFIRAEGASAGGPATAATSAGGLSGVVEAPASPSGHAVEAHGQALGSEAPQETALRSALIAVLLDRLSQLASMLPQGANGAAGGGAADGVATAAGVAGPAMSGTAGWEAMATNATCARSVVRDVAPASSAAGGQGGHGTSFSVKEELDLELHL